MKIVFLYDLDSKSLDSVQAINKDGKRERRERNDPIKISSLLRISSQVEPEFVIIHRDLY